MPLDFNERKHPVVMLVFTRQKYGHKTVWLSSAIQMVALYDFASSTETSVGLVVKVIVLPSYTQIL